MNSNPQALISVIVPCKNAESTIARCLGSLKQQTFTDFEVILVDASSSDQSVRVASSFQDLRLDVLSEPDSGVFDGMNKGASRSQGEWLLFFGTDDILAAPTTFEDVSRMLRQSSSRLVCGSAKYEDGRTWPAPTRIRPLYRNFLHHQACFYHRRIFAVRQYDTQMKFQADYDLNLDLYVRGTRPEPMQQLVSICGAGGLSDSGRWANYVEEMQIRNRYFPRRKTLVWDFGSCLRFVRKRLARSLSSKHT